MEVLIFPHSCVGNYHSLKFWFKFLCNDSLDCFPQTVEVFSNYLNSCRRTKKLLRKGIVAYENNREKSTNRAAVNVQMEKICENNVHPIQTWNWGRGNAEKLNYYSPSVFTEVVGNLEIVGNKGFNVTELKEFNSNNTIISEKWMRLNVNKISRTRFPAFEWDGYSNGEITGWYLSDFNSLEQLTQILR